MRWNEAARFDRNLEDMTHEQGVSVDNSTVNGWTIRSRALVLELPVEVSLQHIED